MSTDSDRPRICISLGPHWAYRFGLDHLTYRRVIRSAGGQSFTTWPLGSGVAQIPRFDGLMLAGGENIEPARYQAPKGIGRPGFLRDTFELDLIAAARSRGAPILGICRGCQLLNVAFGGTLRRLGVANRHRRFLGCFKHPVVIRRNSRLHSILGADRLEDVRSLHHEVVDKPGRHVSVVARGPDFVAEAIECHPPGNDRWWCVGVQWHPELLPWGSRDQALLTEFVRSSKRATK